MKSNKNCLILIADGFASENVSQTVKILQNKNITPIFLNLFKSPLVDRLFAEYRVSSVLIGDVVDVSLPLGLLFAGGDRCAKQLLIDPRVYRLVHQMQETDRPIGCLYPVATTLISRLSQQYSGKPFLLQERFRLDQFLLAFTQQMASHFSSFRQQSASSLLML